MPGFDRTGPTGAGPMTGRSRGRCNCRRADALPDSGGRGYGGGFGFRRGFSGGGRWPRGQGRTFAAGFGGYPSVAAAGYAMEPAEELEDLKQQAAEMSNALNAINKRIDALQPKSTESE